MDKKMWYIHTMKHYSAIKKKEIRSFPGKWMELENIMLNEISQTQNDKYHIFSLICGIQILRGKKDMNVKGGIFTERETLNGIREKRESDEV
jgi:hypothetical protein